ncbi:MAG: hypothetical protein ABIK39_00815 [candidate division WOR-3 bacterium]
MRFFVFLSSVVILVSIVSSPGCFRNSPPEKPILLGPDTAKVGDTISIRVYTIDPEDQVVSYKVEWGDTTTPVWSFFFPSGETIIRTHIYYSPGVYPVRTKAKDIDRGESDWSDTLKLKIN